MTVDNTTAISYPYMPPEGTIKYAAADDPFMQEAKEYARAHSLDAIMPNASVLVKDGQVIGRGANGSTYHDTHGCERVKRGIPTGEGYELCEGCHPKNHSEPKAIADALKHGADPTRAELYLWGHWWCCEPCWQTMLSHDIRIVYLLQGSEKLFNKAYPENIVGRQLS
nr:Cytidine and deoxycytidylate deaminase zinc-binding region [uncultured bacterium]